jgi:hypothetical protein
MTALSPSRSVLINWVSCVCCGNEHAVPDPDSSDKNVANLAGWALCGHWATQRIVSLCEPPGKRCAGCSALWRKERDQSRRGVTGNFDSDRPKAGAADLLRRLVFNARDKPQHGQGIQCGRDTWSSRVQRSRSNMAPMMLSILSRHRLSRKERNLGDREIAAHCH